MSKYENWTADLDALPKEQRKGFVKDTLRGKDNLDIFGRYFFPHIIKGTEEVPPCHMDLIGELAKPNDSGIIFPRGFAKTTWEKIDTIHDIVYALEPVILYVSATIREAQFHFESIKTELETNEVLLFVYGNLVPPESRSSRKWTNLHFETLNGVNVVARGRNKGRGVNIKNNRPSKIIIDDIEDDEEVQSADQRDKLHNWLMAAIFPSKDKERGRIKMIGTVLHTSSEILLFYKSYGGIFRRAIENGQSIWPNYFTLDDLHRIRDGFTKPNGDKVQGIGTRAFAQEYLNEPTNADLAHIKPQWIDNAMYTILPRSNANLLKVITIDPQAGEKAQSDEYAITCVAYYDRDPHRYVLEQKCGRASQLDQALELVKMWLRHKSARIVGVEKVMNQTAVYQNMMSWRTRAIDFNVPGVDEHDRNIPIAAIDPKGKDKLARLQKHEAAFERGEIHLRPEMRDLREQIMYLGTKVIPHDDRVDSLVMALDLTHQSVFAQSDNEAYTSKDETIVGNLMKTQF